MENEGVIFIQKNLASCVREGIFSSTTQLENRYFLKRKGDAFTIRRKTERTVQSWLRYFHRLSGRTRSGVIRLLKSCGENTVLTQAWTGQCCPQRPRRSQPGQLGEETWNVPSTGNESIPWEIWWESWGAGQARPVSRSLKSESGCRRNHCWQSRRRWTSASNVTVPKAF